MQSIIEEYNYLLKIYFIKENKFEVYNELYLFQKKIEKEIRLISKLNKKYVKFFIIKLNEIKSKIDSILNLLNNVAYNKWKNLDYKEKEIINVKNKKVIIYKRYLNFKIESYEDPFTEEEKIYCLYILNIKNKKYEKFEDIPLNLINIIIKGLNKNAKKNN